MGDKRWDLCRDYYKLSQGLGPSPRKGTTRTGTKDQNWYKDRDQMVLFLLCCLRICEANEAMCFSSWACGNAGPREPISPT